MSATLKRILAVGAVVVGIGAFAAPTAVAEERIIGGGSLALCFDVPLPGSAEIVWCL